MNTRGVLCVSSEPMSRDVKRRWSILVPALRARGADVTMLTLFAGRELSAELHAADSSIRCLHVRNRADLLGAWRAIAFAGTEPDLVVTHGPEAQAVGELVASRCGAAHVVVATGERPLGIVQRMLTRVAAPHVDAAITSDRKELPRLVEHGYSPTRLRVIPDGVRALTPRGTRAETRSSFGLAESDFVALLVTTDRPLERPELLVRSVELAHGVDGRIRGLIVGPGSNSPTLKALVAETGDVVRAVGGGTVLAEVMNAADVVYLSSELQQPPTTLLEAMSLGKPAIAPDAGGNRDAIVPGATGVLLPLDDDGEAGAAALVELAGDPNRTRALGEASRARHSKLSSVEHMLEQYVQVFDEAAEQAAASRAATASVEQEPTARGWLPKRITRHWNSALSRGVGYEFTPPGAFFEGSSVRGYYIDFRAKTTSPTSRTPETLLPAGLAQLALGWWERSLAGEAHAVDEFRRVCTLLEERAERRDGQLLWPYDITVRKYPFAWPPYSGLAQAQAASVFVRAHVLSGDPRDAELAQRAIRSLVDEASDLVSTTSAGPILEETPGQPASHILNGWIYALWGLRDVQLALGSADASSMYESSLSCLRRMIDHYDVGWWTRYSLYPHKLPDLAKPFYHRLHADQADILYRLTGFPEFGDAARRWRSYDTRLNCTRAVGQKSLFVATGYA
jgi:glycosyltransferase involved in cell wall biosynthesis